MIRTGCPYCGESWPSAWGPNATSYGSATHTCIEFADGELSVGCPTQFECQWLRSHVHTALQASCQKVLGRDVEIRYHVLSKAESGGRKAGEGRGGSNCGGRGRGGRGCQGGATCPTSPLQKSRLVTRDSRLATNLLSPIMWSAKATSLPVVPPNRLSNSRGTMARCCCSALRALARRTFAMRCSSNYGNRRDARTPFD